MGGPRCALCRGRKVVEEASRTYSIESIYISERFNERPFLADCPLCGLLWKHYREPASGGNEVN